MTAAPSATANKIPMYLERAQIAHVRTDMMTVTINSELGDQPSLFARRTFRHKEAGKNEACDDSLAQSTHASRRLTSTERVTPEARFWRRSHM